MTRRRAIAGIVLASAAPAGGRGADRSSPRSLAGNGAAAGISFGSAVRAASLDDPKLRALLISECATLTPELEMKWAAIAPTADVFSFGDADTIARFARANGQRLRGHALLWHRSIPGWLSGALAGGTDWTIVGRHIRAVVGRYASHVDEWDVVNEPIDLGSRDDGLRDTPFLRAFGRDYVGRAFREAHAAAPHARLAINDYGIEYAVPEQRARRVALLSLVRSLVDAGVPIHTVGLQAHLDIGRGAIDAAGLAHFAADVTALGLRISITELDVKESDYLLPAGERDRLVADHTSAFLGAILPNRAVKSLTCWGLSDRESWLLVTPQDRARFPGAWADGSDPGLNRGLPYDANRDAKPMRGSIVAAMRARSR